MESVWLYGNRPNLLSSIIGTAIAVLELLISKVFLKTLELADKVISKELEARPENTDFKEQKAVPEESRQQTDTPKPAIPPRPQPSPEAVSYKHLCEIYQKLQEQNKAILHSRNSEVTLKLNCPTAKVSSKQKAFRTFNRDSRIGGTYFPNESPIIPYRKGIRVSECGSLLQSIS